MTEVLAFLQLKIAVIAFLAVFLLLDWSFAGVPPIVCCASWRFPRPEPVFPVTLEIKGSIYFLKRGARAASETMMKLSKSSRRATMAIGPRLKTKSFNLGSTVIRSLQPITLTTLTRR